MPFNAQPTHNTIKGPAIAGPFFLEVTLLANTHDTPARLLSIIAGSKALGVSRGTMFGLLASGKLGYVRIGRRRLIPTDAIEAFIAANLVAKRHGKEGRVA